ncbi:MAG: aspartate aminotransferase family protein [Candidatus Latescibacteria bacterium]|nr:aspartate aminotransferase family protein [Candidatus Latescibacterota bacterium]
MTTGNREQLLHDDRYLLHPLHHPADHAEPIIWVKGEGATVMDSEGRTYIDGLSSLWNVNAGHGRRDLAEVAAQQMTELAFFSCYTGSTNVPAIRLAKRLSELAPPRLNTTFFTTGGAESNDSVFKTARFYWQAKGYTEKVKIISRRHAYHGVTLGSMNATGIETYHSMFESRMPGFLHIDAPYVYHYTPKEAGVSCGEAAARGLEEAILRSGPETVAAFIGEPIQGAGGVIVPPDDYWPRIRDICSKYDVLLIADEVITGFGRIGHWFGLSHWDVEPDMMTFAKGITSGYLPLGGLMVSDDIREVIANAPPDKKWTHSFTYSGHATCCAVGLKNIEIIERERLIDRARVMGQRLRDGLESLYDLDHVGDVRGLGLMAAVELVADRATKTPFEPARAVGSRVLREALRRGLYTRARRDTIVLAPPLVVTEAQVDRIVEALRDSIRAVVG